MIKISNATITDSENIQNIFNQTLDVKIDKRQFKNYLTPPFKYLKIIKETKIIGTILIQQINDDTYDILYFAIIQKYQRQKFGQMLINYLDKKYNYILEVRQSNYQAIKFYEKQNFNQIQIKKQYYTNPIEDALVLFKNKKG